MTAERKDVIQAIIFAIDKLERFEPGASFSMTGDTISTTPRLQVSATMHSTKTFAGNGNGDYVKFNDLLHLLCEEMRHDR